jgi:hypothetical protein
MARRAVDVDREDMVLLLRGAEERLNQSKRLWLTRIQEARDLGLSWDQIGEALGRDGEGVRKLVRRADKGG